VCVLCCVLCRGAEYYLLDFDVAKLELARRIRLHLSGFRYHDVAAVRLVGTVQGVCVCVCVCVTCVTYGLRMHIQLGMTAPEFNGRPLDGIFVKETFKLKTARQSMNAECIISLFLSLPPSLSLSLSCCC
jgi:hypothetical protein